MFSQLDGLAAGGRSAQRRFLIVDSHDVMRRSLSRLIRRQSEWCVVGEGVRIARECEPHVAIVDLRLGQFDGFELTQTLTVLSPALRIVGYSFEDDSRSISRFLQAGGHGFVSKHEPVDELVEGIKQALAGRIRVPVSESEPSEVKRHETEPSL